MTRIDEAGLQQALQHEAALRQLAAALLRDPADADDAVQHALVQEACGRRRQGTPLLPFLLATLRRHAANLRKLALRRRRREQRVARTEAVPGAEEMLRKEQLRRRVAAAVLELDERYRTVVWLRWFEQLPARAVAARLQLPLATVRTRLLRAHAALRRQLDRDYGDRRWAVLALPLAGWCASLCAGVAMKKVLVAAVVVMSLLLGYALLPRAAARSEVPAVAPAPAVAAGEVAPDANLDRREVAAAAAPVAGSRRLLRVVHADGSPAADLPVWTWTSSDRPLWTRRSDERPRTGRWPDGTAPSPMGKALPPTPLHTDAEGLLSVGPDPAAITVQCAEALWFSTGLPIAGAVVLPALAPVELTLTGAPPGGRWGGVSQIAWGDDGFGSGCIDITTDSGPGTVRSEGAYFDLEAGEPGRLTLLADWIYVITAWGRGFVLAGSDEAHGSPSANLRLRTPGVAAFHFLRPLPTVGVQIVEGDGSPTEVGGAVWIQDSGREPLQGGVAVLDLGEVEPGEHRIDALLDDGSWLRGGLDGVSDRLEYSVKLQRSDALPPVRVPLGDVRAEGVKTILIDWPHPVSRSASHPFLTAQPFAEVFPSDRHPWPCFATNGRELLLNVLPAGWTQGYVLCGDGRVGRFAAAGQEAPLQWFAPAPPRTIDVGARYRELGDLPAMFAVIHVQLPDAGGGASWYPLLFHRRYPGQDWPTEPPVWRDLRLPAQLRTRLTIEGGASLQTGRTLSESLLTGR